MEYKHGLSQYRLNYERDWAQEIFKTILQIESVFQMSKAGLIKEEVAETFITNNINGLDDDWEYLKSYIEQRDDMR